MASFLQQKKCIEKVFGPIPCTAIKLIGSCRRNILVASVTVLAILCTNTRLASQQIHFDQMSIAEGLSSNSIYSIFQDSYGIIWFGTLDGLNRYDGYNIVVFKHDNLKKGSLSNNRITHIYEDRTHRLWLYDEFSSSIIRYTPDKDEFTSYYLDKISGSELKNLDSLYENKEGTLTLQSIDGYCLQYDERVDEFKFIKKEPTGSFSWHRKQNWSKIIQAFDSHLIKENNSFDSHTIEIRKIIKDSEGRYWIATKYGGLYSAIEQNNRFEFTSHMQISDKYKNINSEEIYDVYEDRSNVIWIGTKNSGLHRHTRYKYKFDQIQEIQLSTGTVPIGTVRAIAQDKNKNIWVGTNGQGLIKIDPSGKTGKLYKPEINKSNTIGHRFIRSLWCDDHNDLWVGHYKGFSKYRPSSDDFIQYFPNTKTNEEIRVYDFKNGRDNTIWMGAWDLILNFDTKTNEYRYISRSESGSLGYSNENIRDLELDNTGEIWLAVGEKGMSIYDKTKNKFTTLHYTPELSNSLPSNNLFDVFKDSNGNFWLATADGLCHFDPVKMTCKNYTINEGLPSNLIYGIMEDKQKNLWFSTTKGIGKFDLQHNTFRNYDVSDGLQSNEFTENAIYQNDDGVMFFGGINGLNFFDPANVPENPNPPLVNITTLKVFDKPLSEVVLFNETDIKRRLNTNEGITLTPEQRSISFEFVAHHYVNPQKNKYAYILEGFDQTWTYRDANVRFANYTNLEPGTYSFKVKAANSDGVWSDDVILKIRIEKPFYANNWFVTIATLLVLGLGIISYRWRIAVVKKQQSMKSIQLESELNFLKSQVNPHFLFNTLNNIYALCQVNSRNAAPMVGKISDMMRYMIYDCTADLVPLQKEIDYLRNYIDLNQLKSNRKLNASIVIEGNPSGYKIAPLLLINFLENSFKHGDLNLHGDGFIKVNIAIKSGELLYKIQNSFRENHTAPGNQTGIGLENVKHRLALLYQGKHVLRISKNNSIFEIELKLTLD